MMIAMRWRLAVSLAFGACMQTHAPTQTEVGGEDCVACHLPDYEGTAATAQPHATSGFPTTCADCHRTSAWVPASGLHPEAAFPRTGPHAPAKGATCDSCHDRDAGLDKAGANTTCITGGCHALAKENGHHDEEAEYQTIRDAPANQSYPASAHFCLASGCHPNGLKED